MLRLRVATALLPEGDVRLVLAATMRGLLTFFAADRDFTWMLCVEANAASPEIRGRRLATVGRLASLLAGLLERGRQGQRAAIPDDRAPTSRRGGR